MPESSQPIIFADSRGGLNSADPPHLVRENQVTAATNVEWYRASLARKRRGSRLVERDTGSTLPTNKKFSTIQYVARLSGGSNSVVIEASDLSAWYGWGYGIPATDFSTVSAIDTPTTNACVVYYNGQWVAAYKSSVDRLHWLGTAGASGYRVGLAAPSGNPGTVLAAGAITDSRRYRYVLYYSSGNAQRSEPSPYTQVFPAAQQVTVNAPLLGGVPPELYSHWEVQVSSLALDSYSTWWVVGTAAATVNIVDNNASLLSLTPAAQEGLFEVPHSAKYLGVDTNRLLLAGAYENVTDEKLQQRVWWTPVMGDRDQGDDARIVETTTLTSYLDLDGGDRGGPITAIGPNILGGPLVFKFGQVWRLTRTGNLDAPYLPKMVDGTTGTFGYRTVCAGQDATGGACVYFAGSRGVFRIAEGRAEYISAQIEDIWATVNQRGNVHTSQHAVYYTDRGQYWLWVSVNGATVPSVLLVYTVATGGWATYTGPLATALCSALMPRFIQEDNKGVTAIVAEQVSVPYCCPNTDGQIAECDAINPSTGVALDTDLETYSGSGSVWSDGTAFQASVTLPPLVKPCDGTVEVVEASVFADAASGVSVSVGLIPDYDSTKTRTASVSIAAAGSEARVMRRVDGAQMGEARAMQATIGDASAVASQWTLHALQLRTKRGGTR